MKKLKRTAAVLLALLMIPTMLIGCKPKIKSDESAKILSNFIVKNDKTKVSQLISDKSQVNGYSKKVKDNFISKLRQGFLKGGVTITDDQCNQIYDAFMGSIKNVTITTKTVSESDTEATVNVKTNYIDLTQIIQNAATQARSEVMSMNLTSESEAKTKVVQSYIKYIVQDLKEAKPTTQTKDKDFKFKKGGDGWIPSNESDFEEQLGQMICGE